MSPDLSEGQPTTASESGPKKIFRVATNHPLPSERVAWAKHFPLLENAAIRSGFGKQPLDSEDIEQGVGSQAASLNVQFFTDVGLLSKNKRQFLPTEACIKFVKMKGLDEPRAKVALREVIARSWFAEAASNALSLRKTMPQEALMRELAIACEVSDFKAKIASFRILIEYLVYTDIVQRDGDNILLAQSMAGAPATNAPTPRANPSTGAPPEVESRVNAPAPPVARPLADDRWDVLITPSFELRILKDDQAWALLNALLPSFQTAVKRVREAKASDQT